MRLTLRLDEDLYRAARGRALAEDRSLNGVINGLIREALEQTGASKRSGRPRRTAGRRGLLISKGSRSFTGEDVARIELSDLADQTP